MLLFLSAMMMAFPMTINPIGTLYQYIQWDEYEWLAVVCY
jgi:hypothetical protein